MALQLEQYIPLPQAAKRLKISSASLKGLIDSGSIKAVKLNGTIAVAESELDQVITREKFEHLQQPITIAQAVTKYDIGQMTIRGWIERGYITVLKSGYGMTIDESDMAYCAAVYHAMGGTPGKRIFDENGQPYQLQKPEWAEYKREWRKKKKTGPLKK